MKTLTALTLTLALCAGAANALELERVTLGEVAALAGELPEPSKAGFAAAESYGTARIFVTAPGGVSAAVTAAYAARKDSHFCTELSWNEGSPVRVPKRIYPEFKAQSGLITVPAQMDGGCDYAKASEGSLSFSLPGRAEAYNSVALLRGGSSGVEQGVVCEVIQAGGPAGHSGEMLNCLGDVRLDASGQARVRVTFKDSSRTKAAGAMVNQQDPKDISGDKLVQFGSVCELGKNQADAVNRAAQLLNEPFVRQQTDVNVWTNAGTYTGTYVRAPYRVLGEATVSKISSVSRYNWLACIPVQGGTR